MRTICWLFFFLATPHRDRMSLKGENQKRCQRQKKGGDFWDFGHGWGFLEKFYREEFSISSSLVFQIL